MGPDLHAGRPAGEILERLLSRQVDLRHTAAGLRARAEDALRRAAAHNIEALGWSDNRYPTPLAAIFDPPPVLWLRGCADALQPPAVAIVGSRAGSSYALAAA